MAFSILFLSCKGQHSSYSATSNQLSAATTSELQHQLDTRTTIIYQDKKGHFWFAGGEHGVYYYDGQSLQLFNGDDGLCSNKILSIQEDHFGHIFFDSQEGVCKYDGEQFSTLEVISTGNEWKSEPDDLWFRMGWNQLGPYRYDGKNIYALEIPKIALGAKFLKIFPNASFSPYGVYTIFKDSHQHIWFGTSSLGACRYNGEIHQWVSEEEMTELDDGPAPGVRSILEDKDGYFWFSSNVSHKYEIETLNRGSKQNELNYTMKMGLNEEAIAQMGSYCMAIAQDDQGNYWFATYENGVWKYDGEKMMHYPVLESGEKVQIFTIYKDKSGNLWLGTHNAGAMLFNGSNFEKFRP